MKYHGLGNDFIMIDAISQSIDEDSLQSKTRKICDRNFGIGADGIILALPSTKSDIRMKIINADGTEPEMCGNGLRCFAKWAKDEKLISQMSFSVETKAGGRSVLLSGESGDIQTVQVEMGEPDFSPEKIPFKTSEKDTLETVVSYALNVNNQTVNITSLSMGNPHAVVFVEDLDSIDIGKLGPSLSQHACFPEGVNAEFAQVLNSNEAKMIVWERGAGPTLACGTGACATVVAGVLEGRLNRIATIHLPGGPLRIEWQSDNHLSMSGPAQTVFRGQFEL